MEGTDDGELALWRLVGVDPVDAERITDSFGYRCPVAGHHAHEADARRMQRVNEVVGVGSDPVAHDDGACQIAVDSYEDPSRAAVQSSVEERAAASAPV